MCAWVQSMPQCTCIGQKTIFKSRFSPFTMGFQDQIPVCSLIWYGKCFHEPFCQPSSLDSTWFLIPQPHAYLKILNNTSSLHLELPSFLFSPCYNNPAYCPSFMEVKILMNPFSKMLLLLESTNTEKMAQQLRVNTACTEDPAPGDQHFWPPQAPTHTHTSLKREENKTGLKDLFQTFSLVFTIFFKLNYTDNFPVHFVHSPTWLVP